MRRQWTTIALSAAFLMWTAGCGSADGKSQNKPKGTNEEPASFAIGSTISGEDSNTTYVKYVDKLDAGELSLDDAREYSGYATIGTVGEMFFVA
ncbi:MAG: hypothetical protein ABEL76_16115 [Bradymonadaceae bacterium]